MADLECRLTNCWSARDSKAHGTHYAEAGRLIAALSDPKDRTILSATLRVVPVPSEGARAL